MKTFQMSVEFSQFHLGPAGELHVLDPQRPAQLAQVTADNRAVIVLTGISMGPVVITIAQTPPLDQSSTPWQERQVVTLDVEEELYLYSFAGDPDDPEELEELEELDDPVYRPRTTGRHTVTIHARGRDIDHDGIREDPCEEYLIVLEPTAYPATSRAHLDEGIHR